ncbi:hypothetical protein ASG17_11090 [Brevundimonas sp. Leaf363]|nr:hypothetical protein ASG17_11090 [Brevundimonas sp. Leaf363]
MEAVEAAPAEAPLVLRAAQRPPEGPWATWLFLGGRGAGKTLAGASWIADQAVDGARLALVGPTLHDVREVMIEGASGVRALPRWGAGDRPRYEPSRRRLVFESGAVAWAFSAEDPESLRGPQFHAAWVDEFCAWPAGTAGETLALLRMGLRLGGLRVRDPSTASRSPSPRCGEEIALPSPSSSDGEGNHAVVEGPCEAPRLVVTTTPKPTKALLALKAEASCVVTQAATKENAAHLAAGFLEGLEALYGGTRRAAQELEGQVVDLDGALFTAEMMAACRWPSPLGGEGGSRSETDEGTARHDAAAGECADSAPSSERLRRPPSPPRGAGSFDRIVVAIDPCVTAHGDLCGIVAAGARRRADGVREAVVLADRSAGGLSPDAWARRAVVLAEEVGAGAVVAEVNQGGAMVRQVLKTAGCTLPVREVRAVQGKRVRAEPVAALYEQGRLKHAGLFRALEEELMAFGAEREGAESLDRADALVWAVTDLLIDAPEGERGPRLRLV